MKTTTILRSILLGLILTTLSSVASAEPRELSRMYSFIEQANAIEVDGDYAFVISSSGLYAYDVSNPGQPTFQRHYPDITGYYMAKTDEHSFVAFKGGYAGQFIDSSDPSNLVLGGTLHGEGIISTLAISKDVIFGNGRVEHGGIYTEWFPYLFVKNEDNAFQRYQLRSYMDHSRACINGNRLYSYDDRAITIYDISDPSQLREIQAFEVGNLTEIICRNELIAANAGDSLVLYSSEGDSLRLIEVYHQPVENRSNGWLRAPAMQFHGDYLFCRTDTDYFRVDVSVPNDPGEIVEGEFPDEFSVNSDLNLGVVNGDKFYAIDDNYKALILDIADFANAEMLSLIGEYGTIKKLSGSLSKLVILGGYGRGGINDHSLSTCGVRIVDASNPASPVELARIDTDTTVFDLCANDDVAVLVQGGSYNNLRKFAVIDITNGSHPVIASTVRRSQLADVALSGNILFALWRSNPNDELIAYDVSNPYDLREIDIINYSRRSNKYLEVDNARLYVGEPPNVYIYDANVRDTIRLIDSLIVELSFGSMKVSGDYVHLFSEGGIFHIPDEVYFYGSYQCYNISDLNNPIQFARDESVGEGEKMIAIHNEIAYIQTTEGVHVVSGETHDRMRVIDRFSLDYPVFDLFVKDSLAVIALGASLGIYEFSAYLGVKEKSPNLHPSTLSLSVFPNPFNSSVTIAFGLDKSAPTRLAIYDINGREVADLFSGKFTPPTPPAIASQTVVWDASSVGAGVYFVRLEAGTEVVTEKIVLIR